MNDYARLSGAIRIPQQVWRSFKHQLFTRQVLAVSVFTGDAAHAGVAKFQKEQSMARLTRAIRNFVRQDDGAALVEYAILIALIAVICLIVVATVGNKVSAKFSEVAAKL